MLNVTSITFSSILVESNLNHSDALEVILNRCQLSGKDLREFGTNHGSV